MEHSPEYLAVQVWVLGGLGTVLFAILIAVIKWGLKSFMSGLETTNNKIEELSEELHELNIHLASQKGDIKANSDRNDEQDKRLNSHSDRIRKLEIEQARKK